MLPTNLRVLDQKLDFNFSSTGIISDESYIAALEDIISNPYTEYTPVEKLEHEKDSPAAVSKGHICTICNKKFSTSSGFHRHLRTHAKKRLFKCKECPETFMQSGHLKQHNDAKHNDLKFSFACELCNSSFTRKSSRKKHMSEIHQGQRSYPCIECSSFFKRTSHLDNHIKKIHPDLFKKDPKN